jgi:hypothetical protein
LEQAAPRSPTCHGEAMACLWKFMRMEKLTTGKPTVSDALWQVEQGSRTLQAHAAKSSDIFEQIAVLVENLKAAQTNFTG